VPTRSTRPRSTRTAIAAATLAGLATAAAPALAAPTATGAASDPHAPTAVAAIGAAPVRINVGGPDVVVGHHRWLSDRYALGGHLVSTRSSIDGTTADEFYRHARAGMSAYRVPVGTAGTFLVTLKFAEIEDRAAGERVFSVRAEGAPIMRRVDISATAGPDRAVSVSRQVPVQDGVLNLNFSAARGEALLSGLSVQRLDPADVAPRPGQVQSVMTANRSGLPWASGVYTPSGNPATYESFGTWRGSRIDVATMWTARSTWAELINPDWLYRTWAGTPMVKVIGVSPIPEGDASATLARCADGRYDDKWAQFARNIKAAGMDDESVIRLGWEFNGNWYKWSAHNPADFASCWRHIVGTAEKIAPALRWDWTVNAGAGQSVRDARAAWPGDDYVDIVGVDSYDVWPGVTNPATWNTHLNEAYGLNFWRDFAVAHRKPLSVPEWGVYPGTAHAGHNGGDNAYYIEKMHGFFAANASVMAYESYFNESASYYAGSLYGPAQNPRAAAAYRTRF
jgi:Malectin domain/Glycosyl hydrolase family 26